MSYLRRLVALTRSEPALIAALAQGALALIVTRFHLTVAEVASIESAGAALAAVAVGLLAKPPRVAGLAAAVTAVGTLLAAFGVHASAGQVSVANAVLAAVMLAFTSLRVTPTVTAKAAAAKT